MVKPCKGDSEVWLMRGKSYDTDRWTGHGKSLVNRRGERLHLPPRKHRSRHDPKRDDTDLFARTTRKPPSIRRTLQQQEECFVGFIARRGSAALRSRHDKRAIRRGDGPRPPSTATFKRDFVN